MSENRQKQQIVIAIIVVLVLAIAGLGFYNYKLKTEVEQTWESLQTKEAELKVAYTRLDSVSGVLTAKIAELEKLGAETEELRNTLAEIQKEKEELKSSNRVNYKRFKDLEGKIEGYKTLIAEKDSEIADLKKKNEDLASENSELLQSRDSLTGEIGSIEQSKNQLENKLKEASVLKAQDFKITAINKKGKEHDEDEFKVKHIETLKIQCKLAENKASERGTKKVMLRVLENGSPLYDVTKGAGNFKYNGQDLFYTSAMDVIYDLKDTPITFTFTKGAEFKPGKCSVEIYCEGNLIGRKDFFVK